MNKPISDFWLIFGKVLADGFFVLLPVITIVIVELASEDRDHGSAVALEIVLAVLVLFADVLRDSMERTFRWARHWRVMQFVALFVSFFGVLGAGIWFGSEAHKASMTILAGAAGLLWFAVKCRVKYTELAEKRFLVQNWRDRAA